MGVVTIARGIVEGALDEANGHANLASLTRYAHFQRASDQAAANLLGALLQRRPADA